jgi:hypothetical protein
METQKRRGRKSQKNEGGAVAMCTPTPPDTKMPLPLSIPKPATPISITPPSPVPSPVGSSSDSSPLVVESEFSTLFSEFLLSSLDDLDKFFPPPESPKHVEDTCDSPIASQFREMLMKRYFTDNFTDD